MNPYIKPFGAPQIKSAATLINKKEVSKTPLFKNQQTAHQIIDLPFYQIRFPPFGILGFQYF